ncbi:MAG: 16S rRNA (uracil(1498)-N(3))-methyltransferase [Candidatus Omnitrophica bacterium]|nr:16S rRNA (uracil(1498)-N(3))-methyltransferase [Candidatus Omnitrophota bacterium]
MAAASGAAEAEGADPPLLHQFSFNVHRFLISPDCVQGDIITLSDPSELHHLSRVLRLAVGDRVACLDGQGREYQGVIARQTSRDVVIQLDRPPREAARRRPLWLAQAMLKSDRFEWVIQKATELGASTITPLITDRVVPTLLPRQASHKLERWRRIAQEAAKQCGRATLPAIESPRPMAEVVPVMTAEGLTLIPTLSTTAVPIRSVLEANRAPQAVAVFIGPEGDFTAAEVAHAQAHGARPVSLGPQTLRAETAAIAALAMLNYALDDGAA